MTESETRVQQYGGGISWAEMVPISMIVFCLGGLVAITWAYYNGASGDRIADIATLAISGGAGMGLCFLVLHQIGFEGGPMTEKSQSQTWHQCDECSSRWKGESDSDECPKCSDEPSIRTVKRGGNEHIIVGAFALIVLTIILVHGGVI